MRPVWSRRPRGATRFTPQRKALDARLRAAGQVKNVALTAWRHTFLTMLNAMLKPWTPWQPQEVQRSKFYKGPLDSNR